MARISLFITLGIAAIDMLSCAFIAAILLFLMFLLPAGASGRGMPSGAKKQILAVQWATDQPEAVLGITLIPPGGQKCPVIWSYKGHAPDCIDLFSDARHPGEPRLLLGPNHASGVFIVEGPAKGKWNINVTYSSTTDSLNSGDPPPVNVDMTVIGRAVISASIQDLMAGQTRDVRDLAQSQNTKAAFDAALTVE